MVRKGIKGWLETEPDITVVAETSLGSEVMGLLSQHSPHVVMLDLHMQDMHGVDVIRKIREHDTAIPIVVMTGYEKQRARAALSAGANGFLNKEESREGVVAAIRWAASRTPGTWLGAVAAKEWMQSNLAIDEADLTKTEIRVLVMIDRPNLEIAEALYLSEGTVKNHVSTIYSKLNVKSRSAAVEWAKRHGILLK